jgi:hypothetical protein
MPRSLQAIPQRPMAVPNSAEEMAVCAAMMALSPYALASLPPYAGEENNERP